MVVCLFDQRLKKHSVCISTYLIIIINLIYITQFDTNCILTVLYVVIKYLQTNHMHI